ncbi:GCN5 family N-acetyltransferase [Pseudoalteromonas sp. A25]|uniref:GNAT family N-acetyltransferase n=1 Tax=Pseudoalteromonas sp. A25 TaxID=116092 RepID=UPI00126062A2|nr:GNAT family N-acetyltransferase [Pseudoalteromonas sp. A25]BBN82200.1 GCN5 family N-acetyltransferase [Pseudoalteromonas sp. A25]
MAKIIEPKTARIQLRQWRPSDLEPFFTMSSDKQVMKYFPATLSRSESDGIANKCQSLIAENGWGVWAAQLLETNEFIGMVGLHKPSADLPSSGSVEVLWRLARPHWGKGYATEAAAAALRVGFEQLNLQEIVSFAVVNNHPSRAVMERINMHNTGKTFMHPDVPAPEHLREHCLYKISREHWAAKCA